MNNFRHIWYDFHIHTCLSPCANEDMTPNNIVNMSILKGLDAICVLDHNTYENAVAARKCSKDKPIKVFMGIEVETAEEVHVVCMFDIIEDIVKFGKIVESNTKKVLNKENIFGTQIIMDENDMVIGKKENLLLMATDLTIEEVFLFAKQNGGVVYPAHIDRSSNSVMSNLGFIPDEIDSDYIEFSKNALPSLYIKTHLEYLLDKYIPFQSSDAHYLQDINEKVNSFKIDANMNIFRALKNGDIEIIT